MSLDLTTTATPTPPTPSPAPTPLPAPAPGPAPLPTRSLDLPKGLKVSFVGRHHEHARIPVSSRTVLPLNLRSDLGLARESFTTAAKLRGRIGRFRDLVASALSEPSKLAYAGVATLGELASRPDLTVMVDDAGWLTRHLPLDLAYCEPYAAWKGTMRDYLEAVTNLWEALGEAIRLTVPMPGVRLLAAEVWDTTPLTALSNQPPHPALRDRHERYVRAQMNLGYGGVLGAQWEAITSLYRTAGMDVHDYGAWACQTVGTWACCTPVRDGSLVDSAELASTLAVLRRTYADRVVVWCHPQSPDEAAAAYALTLDAHALSMRITGPDEHAV